MPQEAISLQVYSLIIGLPPIPDRSTEVGRWISPEEPKTLGMIGLRWKLRQPLPPASHRMGGCPCPLRSGCKDEKQAECLVESQFPWSLVERIGYRRPKAQYGTRRRRQNAILNSS
ncbi:MAG: DUF4433 domain-containing protein [Caldilineaceae bacterium SB0664_bin_22]|nr:DUF4433 domain-containing protein [Caldilineaceae bacterium SB0664_bin_22]